MDGKESCTDKHTDAQRQFRPSLSRPLKRLSAVLFSKTKNSQHSAVRGFFYSFGLAPPCLLTWRIERAQNKVLRTHATQNAKRTYLCSLSPLPHLPPNTRTAAAAARLPSSTNKSPSETSLGRKSPSRFSRQRAAPLYVPRPDFARVCPVRDVGALVSTLRKRNGAFLGGFFLGLRLALPFPVS